MRLRILRSVLYTGFLILAILMGTEFALRALASVPTDGVYTVTEPEFARIPGIFAPGRSLVEMKRPALAHRVTIDTLGYRGADFPVRRERDELRVILAGDSFTWGDYVDDDETLPARLAGALAPSCGRVTVINAGIPSTTIVGQSAMILRALRLDPTVAVVVFHDNDLEDLQHEPMWERLARNREAKSRFPLSVAYPVLRRTALWNLAMKLSGRLRSARRANAGDPVVPAAPVSAADAPDTKTTYVRHLTGLRDSLAQSGIPLLLATYPHVWVPIDTSDTTRLSRWAAQRARAFGIPSVDFHGAFAATGLGPERLSLLPLDGHPSPLAHRLAAAALAEALRRLPEVQALCRSDRP